MKIRKEEAMDMGKSFQMKFGAKEIMYIVSRAFADLKCKAESEQLGLHGLRRNGQLMTGISKGKVVELNEKDFPLASVEGVRGVQPD